METILGYRNVLLLNLSDGSRVTVLCLVFLHVPSDPGGHDFNIVQDTNPYTA